MQKGGQRWLAEVVRSSDVAIYDLRMCGWILLAIGKESRMVYCILEGAHIWLVTSQNGRMVIVRNSDKAGC
jgi:hypothetical protein